MGERKWSRRELLGTSAGAVAGTLFAEPLERRRAAASNRHSGIDRRRAQGGQALLLLGARTECRRAPGQNVRGQISRHCRAGGAFRRRADFPAHRAGAGQRHPRRRCRQLLPTPRITSTGRRTAGSRVTFPRMSRSTFPPIRSIPTECTRHRAPGWKPSATTPTWSGARTRRRAMPTCSTRNGRARSSRAIPATRARS